MTTIGRALCLYMAGHCVFTGPLRVQSANSPEMLTPVPALQALPEYLDNSHKIEIILGAASIRVSDGADPVLLEEAIRILRTVSC